MAAEGDNIRSILEAAIKRAGITDPDILEGARMVGRGGQSMPPTSDEVEKLRARVQELETERKIADAVDDVKELVKNQDQRLKDIETGIANADTHRQKDMAQVWKYVGLFVTGATIVISIVITVVTNNSTSRLLDYRDQLRTETKNLVLEQADRFRSQGSTVPKPH